MQAEEIVQQQLDAYNARDLDAFMATYAKDIHLYDLKTGECTCSGQDTMRLRYQEFFTSNPHLSCRIEKRIVQGNVVIDHEHVTGLTGRSDFHAIAIYEVDNALIARVWFIK